MNSCYLKVVNLPNKRKLKQIQVKSKSKVFKKRFLKGLMSYFIAEFTVLSLGCVLFFLPPPRCLYFLHFFLLISSFNGPGLRQLPFRSVRRPALGRAVIAIVSVWHLLEWPPNEFNALLSSL